MVVNGRSHPKLCLRMSSTGRITSNQGNFTFSPPLPVCSEFYSTGAAAIRAPRDTELATYGTLINQPNSGVAYSLVDRNGKLFNLNSSLIPKDALNAISIQSSLTHQLLFVASVKGSNATAIKVALYVPELTMVQVWKKTSFAGMIYQFSTSTGVSPVGLTRFDFASSITFTPLRGGPPGLTPMLLGKIINYNKNVRINSTACATALCPTTGNSTTCPLLTGIWGSSDLVAVNWDPAAGTPNMIVSFYSGVSYRAAGQTINALMSAKVKWATTWDFGIHGSPVNTVNRFQGAFSRRGAIRSCK
eukprot:CAMPEP_0202900758 /NCGR_PEP_ID=MMETSP1392-20130828/12016_1 /ASSEMBLY_ACC=CAM_ASM_000868 /TAXON_ID=225041 /ORGANISM="Chlamydomonas chlamydogama, Strain SAG 11-48b" /LENGTH=302 /DNA_ID=CAMNT_0049587197 /DNA_START=185 /DNA_END=1093 /DNA_ORIENTATION=-